MKIFDNVNQAYLAILEDMLYNYDFITNPRGLKTYEKTDYLFKIENPLPEIIITENSERNKTIEKYSKIEFDLYESKKNDVESFKKASCFWEKIANKDGTINSAYGFLIWANKSLGNKKFSEFEKCTPWTWCVNSLKKDINTRQAHLKFSLPEHLYVENKDVVCTQHINFIIRKDKINCCVVMRSQDCVKGLVYDMPWFIHLLFKMKDELINVYPNLKIGTYSHFVHSLHIYEKDVDVVKKMLGEIE